MKAILPVLDETRKRPYYLQLYDHISDAILKGEMSAGEKLPSLRSLAKSTGLSITTIEQCYNQLLVEGYIYSKAQSGYYVDRVFPHSEKTVPAAKEFFAPQVSDMQSALLRDAGAFVHDPGCFDFKHNLILFQNDFFKQFRVNPVQLRLAGFVPEIVGK